MKLEKFALVLRKIDRYDQWVYGLLSPHLNGGKILSVGCGEGRAESLLKEKKKINIIGVEITKYKEQKIPVKFYDGKRLPFNKRIFDTTIFVYALHHSNNIEGLLKEAVRVTKNNIIIMDHTYSDAVSKALLKGYDYFANVFYDMPVPFNFLKIIEWGRLFRKLNLEIEEASITSPMNVLFKLKV